MAHLFDESSHVEGSQWRLFRGFDDHCVSTTQRWSYLPRKHEEGEVPLLRDGEQEDNEKEENNPILLT